MSSGQSTSEPIRKPEEDIVTESTDVQEPKTEAGAEPEAEHRSEYTTQTGDASAAGSARTPATS